MSETFVAVRRICANCGQSVYALADEPEPIRCVDCATAPPAEPPDPDAPRRCAECGEPMSQRASDMGHFVCSRCSRLKGWRR